LVIPQERCWPSARLLLAENRRGDAMALFLSTVGMPEHVIAGMRSSPAWRAIEAVAHTLAYDAALEEHAFPGSAEFWTRLACSSGFSATLAPMRIRQQPNPRNQPSSAFPTTVGGGAWESNPPSTRKLAEQPF